MERNDNIQDWGHKERTIPLDLDQPQGTQAPSIPSDPVDFAISHLHFTPDPTQARILRSRSRRILLCMGRRAGKTFTVSTRAVHFALTHPHTETLLFSRSQRQANILLWNVRTFLRTLGMRCRGDGMNDKSLLLPNGSRIISLPPEPDTIVGYTPGLIILDEAARIEDTLFYQGVSPMLILNDPTIILLSTPNGRRGFFYREWSSSRTWDRFFSPTAECPRVSPEYLEEQRQSMPEILFRQEFNCEFLDSSTSFFPELLLERAIDDTLDPFFVPGPVPEFHVLNAVPRGAASRDFFLGLDIGQLRDPSAITVIERLHLYSDQRDRVTWNFLESWQHRVRHMERVPLMTPYRQIVDRAVEIVQKLKGATGTRSIELVVDATAVGQPIVEMLRSARPECTLVPVTITGADSISSSGDTYRIPKRDLMNRLHVMLEDNVIRIPKRTPELDHFRDEFRSFRLHLTPAGHDKYSATGDDHDDLVLSLALAAWRSFK